MQLRSILLPLNLVAPAALVLMLSGCGPSQVGQYSVAKDSWDSPPSSAQREELRHRLAHTQHDH